MRIFGGDDLADLRDRVLRVLSGARQQSVPAGTVLVALDLPPSRFLGIDWKAGSAIALAGWILWEAWQRFQAPVHHGDTFRRLQERLEMHGMDQSLGPGLIQRAGFPPVHLAEINFQGMYEQQQAQAAQASAEAPQVQ